MKIKKYMKSLFSFIKSPFDYYHRYKFISYMNSTAMSLGMNNSYFDSPSGASNDSYSTAYDLFLLADTVFSNNILQSLCSTESFIVSNHHIHNDAMQEALAVFPMPISLKTGTWGSIHKSLCLKTDDFSICIMSSNKEVFNDIFSVANQIIHDLYIPNDDVSYYGFIGEKLISHNENKAFIPASTTKLLTALCIYNICRLKGNITIKHSDIANGSGSIYSPGETFSIKDAVRIMLMESSNTLANTLARECGLLMR